MIASSVIASCVIGRILNGPIVDGLMKTVLVVVACGQRLHVQEGRRGERRRGELVHTPRGRLHGDDHAADVDNALERRGDAVGEDAVGGDAVWGDAVGGDAVGGDAAGEDAVGVDAAEAQLARLAVPREARRAERIR